MQNKRNYFPYLQYIYIDSDLILNFAPPAIYSSVTRTNRKLLISQNQQ